MFDVAKIQGVGDEGKNAQAAKAATPFQLFLLWDVQDVRRQTHKMVRKRSRNITEHRPVGEADVLNSRVADLFLGDRRADSWWDGPHRKGRGSLVLTPGRR